MGRRRQGAEITTRLSTVQGDIQRVEAYRARLDDLAVLFQMAAEELSLIHI